VPTSCKRKALVKPTMLSQACVHGKSQKCYEGEPNRTTTVF